MPTQQEIVSICEGTPSAFAESVIGAFTAIFEQESPQQATAPQQQNGDTVPVDADNLVSGDNAETISGLIKNAQQAQQQADNLQAQADTKKDALRDALAISGNEQQNTSQQNSNGQQNAQA